MRTGLTTYGFFSSRIKKRAGGGFDASYNAQTAVDGQALIIVVG